MTGIKKWLAASLVTSIVGLVAAGTLFHAQSAPTDGLRLARVPNGGIQPQVARDTDGTLHLVYFKGDSGKGDVFYVRSTDEGITYSSPVRVNSQPGSAVAGGNIRGAQIAVGKGRRVHVAWNGSSIALPKGPPNPEMPATNVHNALPMLYARINDSGTAFEPQRNLMTRTFALDGGGSLAADAEGSVYVAWHAGSEGPVKGEEGRRVWIATSRDGGKNFSPEAPAFGEPTGACGCCGMRIFAGSNGDVYALYRSATEKVHRDIYLLVSQDQGRSFRGKAIHKWNIGACPLSSMTLAEGPDEILAAWQTKEQVYYAAVDAGTLEISEPVAATGNGKRRKYPALAVNAGGDKIFVWSENTGWGEGGSLAWQVFDKKGRPTEIKGNGLEIPQWSFGAAFARADGGFTVLY